MVSAHTPGPWAAAGHIVYAGEFRVATVQAVGAKANRDAELIAAAPDLLAALEAVISDLQEGICIAEDEGGDEAWLAGAKARRAAASAAIAKARGEA